MMGPPEKKERRQLWPHPVGGRHDCGRLPPSRACGVRSVGPGPQSRSRARGALSLAQDWLRAALNKHLSLSRVDACWGTGR